MTMRSTAPKTPVLDRRVTLHIPGPFTLNAYNERIPGPATDHPVWARRQDPSPADQLDYDNEALLNRNRAVYTIRHRVDVVAGVTITDDYSQTRTIIGVGNSELRNRYLHLLTEAIS